MYLESRVFGLLMGFVGCGQGMVHFAGCNPVVFYLPVPRVSRYSARRAVVEQNQIRRRLPLVIGKDPTLTREVRNFPGCGRHMVVRCDSARWNGCPGAYGLRGLRRALRLTLALWRRLPYNRALRSGP